MFYQCGKSILDNSDTRRASSVKLYIARKMKDQTCRRLASSSAAGMPEASIGYHPHVAS